MFKKQNYVTGYHGASMPDETIIRFSRTSNLIEMWLMIIIAIAGIITVVAKQELVGGILITFGIYMAVKKYWLVINTAPQITLNNIGIQTASTPFYKWSEIKNESAICVKEHKKVNSYLTYHHPAGSEQLLINSMEVDRQELEDLLKIYRARFDEANKESSYAHH